MPRLIKKDTLESIKFFLFFFACFFSIPYIGGLFWILCGLWAEEYFLSTTAKHIGFVVGFLIWLPAAALTLRKLNRLGD